MTGSKSVTINLDTLRYVLEILVEEAQDQGVNVDTFIDRITGYGTVSEDTYHAYWSTVRAIAEEVIEDCKNDSTLDEYDQVWESVDGNYWVIYYHAQVKALEYTDNADAYFDQVGKTIEANSFMDFTTELAFAAMVADVQGLIERLKDEEVRDDG